MKTGNSIVDSISSIRFEGIKIPHQWLGHPWLCDETGKKVQEGKATGFQLDAAYVLAEICFFYTAAVDRDSEGHELSVRVRFDGEVMYQDYEVWAAKLGLTKRELQDIIAFLRRKGIIGVEIKPATLRSGTRSNNMPHIWPIVDKIKEMTAGGGVSKKREASPEKTRGVTQKKETRPAQKGETVQYVHSVGTSEVHQQAAVESKLTPDEIEALAESLSHLRMPINEARRHAKQSPELVRECLEIFATVDKSKLTSLLASVRSFFKDPTTWRKSASADNHTNGATSTPRIDAAKLDAAIAREETTVYEALAAGERAEVDKEVDRGESFSAVMQRRYNIRARATDIVARALKSGK